MHKKLIDFDNNSHCSDEDTVPLWRLKNSFSSCCKPKNLRTNSIRDSTVRDVCLIESAGYESRIESIAEKYGFSVLSDTCTGQCRFTLEFNDGALKLNEPGKIRYRSLYVRSNNISRASRRTLLGQAIGRKTKTVVDATAGLGGDSVLLARMGYTVFAVERNPVVSALLEDGIGRISVISDWMSIGHGYGDARLILAGMNEMPDVIYLDPMYPGGRKQSVKVARPLRILRELAGDDTDADELLAVCLESALKRVVVKRPHFAEPLDREGLTGSVSGKLVRYDIYQLN